MRLRRGLFLRANFFASILRRKLPENHIEVIVNGIDENVDCSDVSDDGYFLYLGRLSQEKAIANAGGCLSNSHNACCRSKWWGMAHCMRR
ncbi:hypothetical protein [Vibrio sp. 03_296]|uniref:hypothetical protein n=1 Tax=Vibrio sp. 03_296 TaxID=2024409 RepID=UPI002D80F6FC|nr:hypothetical protein [Vibrio sp. 03_296]